MGQYNAQCAAHIVRHFWRISLCVTDDAIAKLLCDEQCSQIERNGRKFGHIELLVLLKLGSYANLHVRESKKGVIS